MDHQHLRFLWNLYTELLINGRNSDAKVIREAITVAEKSELEAVGRFA